MLVDLTLDEELVVEGLESRHDEELDLGARASRAK